MCRDQKKKKTRTHLVDWYNIVFNLRKNYILLMSVSMFNFQSEFHKICEEFPLPRMVCRDFHAMDEFCLASSYPYDELCQCIMFRHLPCYRQRQHCVGFDHVQTVPRKHYHCRELQNYVSLFPVHCMKWKRHSCWEWL